MLRLFCCTIPFGTDSHFAQALVFVSRGLVAKNAPQEHFLNAPTDGAPSEILEQGGGTQCRKERHSAAFLSPRENPRECGGCGKARRWGEAGP